MMNLRLQGCQIRKAFKGHAEVSYKRRFTDIIYGRSLGPPRMSAMGGTMYDKDISYNINPGSKQGCKKPGP
jgi:hypothetical protein